MDQPSSKFERLQNRLREIESERRSIEAELGRLGSACDVPGSGGRAETSFSRIDEGSSFTEGERVDLFLKRFRAREGVYPQLWENLPDGWERGLAPLQASLFG